MELHIVYSIYSNKKLNRSSSLQIMLYAGIVSTTFLFALPLYLFVEAPACQLQKLLLSPKRRPQKGIEDANANHVKPTGIGGSSISVSTVSTHM